MFIDNCTNKMSDEMAEYGALSDYNKFTRIGGKWRITPISNWLTFLSLQFNYCTEKKK